MKKSLLIIFAVIAVVIVTLLVIFYFVVWIPQATEITTISASELRQSNNVDLVGVGDAISSSLADITDLPAHYDSVYVVEKKQFFKDTEPIYIIPYVIADIIDVGTAGTVSWNFFLDVLLLTRDGSSVVPLIGSVRLRDSEFLVEANTNTAILPEYSRGRLGNRELVVLENVEPNELGGYTLRFRVATKNSAVAVNAECQTLIQWKGSIVSVRSTRFTTPITFEVGTNIDYLNNAKSSND